MRKLVTIGAAITAIAALTAVAATTASAAAPEFSKEKVKFTSFAGPGTLGVVGGTTIECGGDKDTGEITSKTEIIDTFDLEKCKALGIVGAHSLGDPEGTILTTVRGKLCLIKAGDVGILLEATGIVHIEIPSVSTLLQMKGSVTGLITPINIRSLRFELNLVVVNSNQIPEECESKKDELLIASNGGTFTKSTEASTEVIGFLASEVEVIE